MGEETTGVFFFETSGFSMWPFLRSGEKLLVKKVPLDSLRIGDLVVYRADKKLICHRLIKKVKQGEKYLLYVRGDSSLSRPEPIGEEVFLLGKAISVIKNGKVIALDRMKWRFINRLIVLVAPLISRGVKIMKPLYLKVKGLINNGKRSKI